MRILSEIGLVENRGSGSGAAAFNPFWAVANLTTRVSKSGDHLSVRNLLAL
jgi:hypothetical protein